MLFSTMWFNFCVDVVNSSGEMAVFVKAYYTPFGGIFSYDENKIKTLRLRQLIRYFNGNFTKWKLIDSFIQVLLFLSISYTVDLRPDLEPNIPWNRAIIADGLDMSCSWACLGHLSCKRILQIITALKRTEWPFQWILFHANRLNCCREINMNIY